MAIVRLQINGELGSIGLKAYVEAVSSWVGVLADLDCALSKSPKGSVDWTIRDIRTGSICIEAESHLKKISKNGESVPDVGREIVRTSITGFRQLEVEGTTPPFISERGIKYASKLLKSIGRNGITGYETSSGTERTKISSKASANIEQLLPSQYTSIGSVEGRLETITVHRRNSFTLFDHRTNKAIRCDFKDEQIEIVKAALGHRVNVFGLIYWNSKGEPIRVVGKDIRELKDKLDPALIRMLEGKFPNLTGSQTTEEFLRNIRER